MDRGVSIGVSLPPEASILFELENGMPLLIEYPVEREDLSSAWAVWTSKVVIFPLQAVYMPFMQRLIGHLGGQAQGGERVLATLGDTSSL